MKIKNLEIINHPVFTNHTVIFGTDSIPVISFLVGNNGSGKTHVLDIIYKALSGPFNIADRFEVKLELLLTEGEKNELGIAVNNIRYCIRRAEGVDSGPC